MRSNARRNTIAIALVAVALCADRTTLAASSVGHHHRADRTTFAGQIVRKLQVSLRRIVPAVEPLRERQSALVAPAAVRPAPLVVATVPPHPPVSPFESRLPPPGC